MEKLIIIISTLLLLSVIASKAAGRIGVPSLLVFLVIGILGGANGIEFHDLELTQGLATLSLCFILFYGGLDTDFETIRPIWKSGLLLASIGVAVSAAAVGWFAHHALGLAVLPALILGATVSSTDVAAVFTVLRSSGRGLTKNLQSLIEFESAVNDPISVILCVGVLQVALHPDMGGGVSALAVMLIKQVVFGGLIGWYGGTFARICINEISLEFEGLYPALTVSLVLLIYGVVQTLGGSGFLAVYLVGLNLGNHAFLHRKALMQFHNGLAWITQIAMFLTMGLLVKWSELTSVAGEGLMLSLFLMIVARPLSVHLCLLPARYSIEIF